MKNSILLMADDDEDDRMLVADALEECEFGGSLEVVENGEELLEVLRSAADGGKAMPDLILLDLNMPRMDGYEALKEIKRSDRLGRIPVVVFTTSDAEEDVRLTYDLGVNSFLTKPRSYESLVNVIRALKDYWFGITTLPQN